ncbi:hypothetical protein GGR51DRAFT_569257 [Nemania sp. FL0031]|nr:hypothetical protein GGR51DRAFT_569257 [Nemania sp. FL0031]
MDASGAQVHSIPPTLKQTNVLDFPNEILFRIFDFVRSSHLNPGYGSPNGKWFSQDAIDIPPETRDIQNVRLTCRRFCDASSHLLLDYVCVEMQTASLTRLHEISRHPTICKGIRVVDVRLTFYHSKLTDDPGKIYSLWCRLLYPSMDSVQRQSFQSSAQSIRQGNYDGDALFLPLKRSELRFKDLMKAMQVGQTMYQERYRDQEQLLKSGQFVQSIVVSLTQLPFVQVLKIGSDRREIDEPYQVKARFYGSDNDPIKIAKICVRPLDWQYCEKNSEYNLPLDVMVGGMLGSLANAGTTIRSVVVDLSIWRPSPLFIQSPRVREDLGILAKQLTGVSVHIYKARDLNRQVFEDTYDFLSTILCTKSLTRISVGIICFAGLIREPPSIGPILNCQRRPDLTHLYLGGVAIRLNELHRLVDSIFTNRSSPNKGVNLSIDSVWEPNRAWFNLREALYTKNDARRLINELGIRFRI